MVKAFFYSLASIFLFIHLGDCNRLFASGIDLSNVEKHERLIKIDKSLDSLKRWQGQYLHKQKSYQTRASRLLFRNSTESRQYRELAQEAKENVLVLQDQIDSLISQKQNLVTP